MAYNGLPYSRITMRLKFLTISMVILCAGTAAAAEDTEKWTPAVEFEGRINSDRSLASPKFLIPLAQDRNSLLFTDLRSRIDDHGSEEYNVGLGYRTMRGDWIYGGYMFADYLSSANNNHYWQGTGGLEALSEDWDVRINGYLPEGAEHSTGGSSRFFIDGGGNFGISHDAAFTERCLAWR